MKHLEKVYKSESQLCGCLPTFLEHFPASTKSAQFAYMQVRDNKLDKIRVKTSKKLFSPRIIYLQRFSMIFRFNEFQKWLA